METLTGSLLAEGFNTSNESIFVFEAIPESGVRPGSLGIVSLIFKSGTIDVVVRVRRIVERAVDGTHAGRIAVQVHVSVTVKVVEASETVLPSRRRCHGKFRAA